MWIQPPETKCNRPNNGLFRAYEPPAATKKGLLTVYYGGGVFTVEAVLIKKDAGNVLCKFKITLHCRPNCFMSARYSGKVTHFVS